MSAFPSPDSSTTAAEKRENRLPALSICVGCGRSFETALMLAWLGFHWCETCALRRLEERRRQLGEAAALDRYGPLL